MYVNTYLVEHLAVERVQERNRAARRSETARQAARNANASRSASPAPLARLLASLRLAPRA